MINYQGFLIFSRKMVMLIFSRINYILLFMYTETCFAQSAPVINHSIMSASDIIKLFISLFSVIVLVFFFSYLFKKVNQVSFGGQGAMKILASLPVGPHEKIMIVKVAEESLLIGVSQGSISLLKKLDDSVIQQQEISNQTAFVDTLKQYLYREDNK